MEKNNGIWFLENVDLFRIFCPIKYRKWKNAGDTIEHGVTFDKHQFIYFPNDTCHSIYFIDKGRVKIGCYSEDGKEIIKAILHPGEIFGEMALLGEETQRDFAQALDGKVTICPMMLDKMQDLLRDNANLSLSITKLIGFRLKKIERRLESLVFKDARSRIIELIKDLAQERGEKFGDEIFVKDFLTHQDIANLTGSSRQTVTTVLNELKEANHINFERKRLLVRSLNF